MHIGTDHHVIFLMSEYVSNNFTILKFTAPVSGMLRKVIDNNNTTRNKIYLNELGITNGEYLGVSMMLKTGTEMAQYYTVFNYITPRTQKDINYK